jgi:hypothetical protein
MAFSQDPISKGTWAYKDGKPVSVTIDYGTELTAEDIERLSAVDSLSRISMGYAGVDSEYVSIEGDLLKLGGLKNLEVVYLNIDGIVDDDLKFTALLPKLRELEFNAKNGEGGCTERCADFLSEAKTLLALRIYNGQFTDKFIDKITRGMPNLEELMLSSPELTDESLRLIAERCQKLKSLSISSDHFTAEGLKYLDRWPNLRRSVNSPVLRQRRQTAPGAEELNPAEKPSDKAATSDTKSNRAGRRNRRCARHNAEDLQIRELIAQVQKLQNMVATLQRRIDRLEDKHAATPIAARSDVARSVSEPRQGIRYQRPPLHAFTPEAQKALENGASFLNRVSNIPFNHRSWVDPTDITNPHFLVPIDDD